MLTLHSVIVHKTATGASWRSCFDWASKPRKPLIGSLFPALVYFGTFATANLLDSLYSTTHNLDKTTISSTAAKLFATTIVSTTLGIYKDGYYARLYGGGLARSSPVPLISYALFTGRDAVTVFASFHLPALLAPHLSELSASAGGSLAALICNEAAGLKAAQMAMPALTQFVTTPMHLLGLDLYNRPLQMGIRERVSSIRKHAPLAVPLRMMRALPVFGMGNMANTCFRNSIIHGMN